MDPNSSNTSSLRVERVCFITLGCAKNEADSDAMKRKTAAAGYALTEDPDDADVIVVNTCSFIEEATEESLEVILETVDSKQGESGQAHVIVSGCMPSRYGDDLTRELPEVSTFIPCADEDSITEAIARVLNTQKIDPQVPDIKPSVTQDLGTRASDTFSISSTTANNHAQPKAAVSSYVKISEGCNRFCSYCAIPYIRGRYVSRSLQEIEHEVSRNVSEGSREIVLIAQDTGRWGDDFDHPLDLGALVGHLAQAHPDTWFRIMYIQPEGITVSLLDAIASHDNVCSYFDVPIQHVAPHILTSMNRNGSYDEYAGLFKRIREKVPDATLRTTVIAGYPGESEADFELLCDFLSDTEFDYVGVFPYSAEEGTRAALLPGQIDKEVKINRAQRIRDLADSISIQKVSLRVGSTISILVIGEEDDGQLFGRAQCQAPDVDGVVFLDAGTVGQVVSARITDSLLYEMEGECL